ncbi:MAG: hypothetical protein FJ255_00190 [Phycisphaerae bacterium]|nr:hypothetical protein [Phycisphaerae bacterium]
MGWALLLLPAAAAAQPDLSWLIYRADLTTLEAVEIRLEAQSLHYRDARGQRRSIPRQSIAAILRVDSAATFLEHGRTAPPPAPPRPTVPVPEEPGPPADAEEPPPMASLIALTDGQVFRGRLSPQAPSRAETALWDTPHFGTLILPLDRLAWVRLNADAELPDPASGDALRLSNGDRLEGFVGRLQPTVDVEPAAGGKPIELAPAQVASIRLANPAAASTAPRVWLGDGTIADLDQLTTERAAQGGEVFAVRLPSGQVADVPPDQLLAARLASGVLLPLAQLDARAEPPADRPWTPPLRTGDPSPLGLADIELPGPMKVSWTLPRGAIHLSLTAELPLDARLWGDATLTIALDGTLASVRLSSAEPSHDLTLGLPRPDRADRVLTATLDQGRFGPIQDRATLKRALLSIAR